MFFGFLATFTDLGLKPPTSRQPGAFATGSAKIAPVGYHFRSPRPSNLIRGHLLNTIKQFVKSNTPTPFLYWRCSPLQSFDNRSSIEDRYEALEMLVTAHRSSVEGPTGLEVDQVDSSDDSHDTESGDDFETKRKRLCSLEYRYEALGMTAQAAASAAVAMAPVLAEVPDSLEPHADDAGAGIPSHVDADGGTATVDAVPVASGASRVVDDCKRCCVACVASSTGYSDWHRVCSWCRTPISTDILGHPQRRPWGPNFAP